MPRLEVRPFVESDVPAAAALLADRHRRHRLAAPLLSRRYEDADVTAIDVSAALAVDDASGAVALRGGEMVGYLLGAPKPGDLWGTNVWVESAGQATTDAEAMRDLYAVAAGRWVEEDRKAQYVLVPASDVDLVRAWFRLGFGQQHAHAIRRPIEPGPIETGPGGAGPGGAAGHGQVSVRRATRADIPELARLDGELPRHQALAPTFSAGRAPSLTESVLEWNDDIDDPDYATFVAERDGAVIGSAVGCPLVKSSSHWGPARPDNSGFLAIAAVQPDQRGSGAGRALGKAVLTWANDAGFDSVVIDWRVTNVLASRAWPALGFTETFLRLHRLIGY